MDGLGIMNTAGQTGAFVSGVSFSYIAKLPFSHDVPVPVVIGGMLLISGMQCLRIDATREVSARQAVAVRVVGKGV